MSRVTISHEGFSAIARADAVAARLTVMGHAVGLLKPYASYLEDAEYVRRVPAQRTPHRRGEVPTDPMLASEQRTKALRVLGGEMLLVVTDPLTRTSMQDIVSAVELRDRTKDSANPLYREICVVGQPEVDELTAEALRHYGVIGLADSDILTGLDVNGLVVPTPFQLPALRHG